MSDRTEVEQKCKQVQKSHSPQESLPKHHYSREELLALSKSPFASRRPECLEEAFVSENGKWDPDKWYRSKFGVAREASPLTLGSGKEQRKSLDRDRNFKKRSSINDPVERLKEEKDGIILSPQRRSFGTGCHVRTATAPYTRQLSLPDRDDLKVDRDSREKPVRKIGSGRIAIGRENNRNYSNKCDEFDEHDHSRNHERGTDNSWGKDQERTRERNEKERAMHDSDRDLKLDRSDNLRRNFKNRDWREREFRDRGADRNTQKRQNRNEKEPEWYSGGPASRTDVIELRGFELEEETRKEVKGRKVDLKTEKKTKVASAELANEPPVQSITVVDKGSLVKLPDEEPKKPQTEQPEQNPVSIQMQREEKTNATTQTQVFKTLSNKKFDFEEMFAILPLPKQDENGIQQGSRFSRFFSGGNIPLGDHVSLQDMHMSFDDSNSSHIVPSPPPVMGPMGAMQQAVLGMHHLHGQEGDQAKLQFPLHHHVMSVPNSAGDNNATVGKSSMPPSVTALFNSAALGGPTACKWNPYRDCSVESPESSLLTNSAISSNGSFNTQDAEAQLKAMLFGGYRDSASSSGAASPAHFPQGVQSKAKTVAELEADMHQNSPQKTASLKSLASYPPNSGDVTAFNKLLIMLNAATEANQNNMQLEHQAPHAAHGTIPSHSEFSYAVLRNREKQMQLLQQSLQNAQRPAQVMPGAQHHPVHSQVLPPASREQQMLNQQQAHAAAYQQLKNQQQMAYNNQKQLADLIRSPTPGLPQAMSTPQPNAANKMRAQGVFSSDPIFSLIQQNPKIIMNPASPAPQIANLMPPQQQTAANTTRTPSPIIFSQQPPLHLRAPSPVLTGHLSPPSLALGGSLTGSPMSSPTGMRSPVLPRVLSPQELSAHAQAVMQSALIKKQLQDQNERYMKKQLERAKSPGQLQIVIKPQPPVQHILPPNPQPKGVALDTFTPTSVLRKMHSDKAQEKEKQVVEVKTKEGETGGNPDQVDGHPQEDVPQNSDAKLAGDFTDISFLDPVNPNLVAINGQPDAQVKTGQTDVLPGALSQPMSVEEKMKLSALAENPGYLSHMLDKAAAEAAETTRPSSRPVLKAEEPLQGERNHQESPSTLLSQGGRMVTGDGAKLSFSGSAPPAQNGSAHVSNAHKPVTGRAIVGGSSAQQQQMPSTSPTPNLEMLRILEQQHFQQQQQQIQRLHQGAQGSVVLPSPHMGTAITCMGPPPVAVPVGARIPVLGHFQNSPSMMHQQIIRANAFSAQHNQQMSQLMAIQHSQQQHGSISPLPPLHTVITGVSTHLSPHGQAPGPLSPAALTAAIQRIALPHAAHKINGPMQQISGVNAGGITKMDLSSGIQRWFGPDILRTQLPSLPPLPSQGSHVLTVDELERC